MPETPWTPCIPPRGFKAIQYSPYRIGIPEIGDIACYEDSFNARIAGLQ